MEVRFIKTHKDAKMPKKNYEGIETGDAGFDMFAVEDVKIPAGSSAVVPVGLKLGFITPGYWFKIEARSGLGFKKSLFPHFRIIDNGYRGDLGVKIYNLSNEDQVIKKGRAAAQLITYKMIPTRVSWISEVESLALSDMEDIEYRGEKGFGSSDE